jgi:hypothetical protein
LHYGSGARFHTAGREEKRKGRAYLLDARRRRRARRVKGGASRAASPP